MKGFSTSLRVYGIVSGTSVVPAACWTHVRGYKRVLLLSSAAARVAAAILQAHRDANGGAWPETVAVRGSLGPQGVLLLHTCLDTSLVVYTDHPLPSEVIHVGVGSSGVLGKASLMIGTDTPWRLPGQWHTG